MKFLRWLAVFVALCALPGLTPAFSAQNNPFTQGRAGSSSGGSSTPGGSVGQIQTYATSSSFGAVTGTYYAALTCDGSTDNTTALAAAIVAAESNTAPLTLRLPAGVCITGPITVTAPITIACDANTGTTIELKSGSTSDMFTVFPIGSTSFINPTIQSSNCTFTSADGAAGANSVNGFRWRGGSYAVSVNFDHTRFQNFSNDGWYNRAYACSGTFTATPTNTSTTVTLSSTVIADKLAVGCTITGTDIPSSTVVSSVTDLTHIVISQAATGSPGPETLTVGGNGGSGGADFANVWDLELYNNGVNGLECDSTFSMNAGILASAGNGGYGIVSSTCLFTLHGANIYENGNSTLCAGGPCGGVLIYGGNGMAMYGGAINGNYGNEVTIASSSQNSGGSVPIFDDVLFGPNNPSNPSGTWADINIASGQTGTITLTAGQFSPITADAHYTANVINGSVGLTVNLISPTCGTGGASSCSLSGVGPIVQNTPPTTSPRNLVWGGDLGSNPWQAGTSFTSAAATTTFFTADDWWGYVGSDGTTEMTVSRQTDAPTQFQDSMKVQRASASTNTAALAVGATFTTAATIRAIAGQPLTCSFWAKAGANFSATGINVYIVTGTGTNEGSADIPSATWTNAVYTEVATAAAITTSWVRYNWTTYVPAQISSTAVAEAALLIDDVPVGTAGANDWFEVAGVQCETATAPTPFEVLPSATVLARAREFYEKSYDVGTAPGTSTPNGSTVCFGPVLTVATYAQANCYATIAYRVHKFKAPTLTAYASDGTSGKATDGVASSDVTATFTNSGLDSTWWYASPAAAADASILLYLQWVADARL